MTPAEIKFELNEEMIEEQDPIATLTNIPRIPTQYIEIDVESDDVVASEESKNNG